LLQHLAGPTRLIGCLLYGGGLRLLECLQLRIKDIDFSRKEVRIRDGKGRKDRVPTTLRNNPRFVFFGGQRML
jgi:integrase